jgi:uncharacterized membrane protein YedE/YeeE
MAVATVTATLYEYPKGIDQTRNRTILTGTFSFGYGTYPPGGYTIDWASVKNSSSGRTSAIPIGSATTIYPIEADVYDVSPTPKGYVFVVDNVGTLHVFVAANAASGTSGPLIEGVGPNSQVPADLANATIQFNAQFIRE